MFKYLEKVLYRMFIMKYIFFLSHFSALADDFLSILTVRFYMYNKFSWSCNHLLKWKLQ